MKNRLLKQAIISKDKIVVSIVVSEYLRGTEISCEIENLTSELHFKGKSMPDQSCWWKVRGLKLNRCENLTSYY